MTVIDADAYHQLCFLTYFAVVFCSSDSTNGICGAHESEDQTTG